MRFSWEAELQGTVSGRTANTRRQANCRIFSARARRPNFIHHCRESWPHQRQQCQTASTASMARQHQHQPPPSTGTPSGSKCIRSMDTPTLRGATVSGAKSSFDQKKCFKSTALPHVSITDKYVRLASWGANG